MDELKIPDRVSKYLVMTLNGKGPCTTFIDDYSKEFIQYAANQAGPVLELGSAYGYVTIEALKAGATVIANDLDPRHLNILYNQTPFDCRSHLTLLPGEFPQDLNIENNSLSGCYVAHMLGYLEPTMLQLGFEKIFRSLKSNTKLFIITSTPYKGVFRNLIAPYEQKVKENQQWPGYFTGLKKIINARIPDALHFFDDHILTRELEHVGFIVERMEFYARTDLPQRALWDGREGLFAIARKP